MPEILEKLFNSKARVKLFRLFLNNIDKGYLAAEAAGKSKISLKSAQKEIKDLEKSGFLTVKKKAKKTYYFVNQGFPFYDELKKLIFKASPSSSDKIKLQAVKIGQIRFMLISGTLINSDKCRVDMMIVGEHINKNKLKNFLSSIEADIGKGINYVCMSTDEFRYRKGMFDKFIIDILESPHRVLIDKLKFNT